MPATKGTKARTTAVKRAKKTLAATNPLIPPLNGRSTAERSEAVGCGVLGKQEIVAFQSPHPARFACRPPPSGTQVGEVYRVSGARLFEYLMRDVAVVIRA